MPSPYRAAAVRFLKKHSGPAGDTKYDIFDRGEPRLGRARLRRNRTHRYVPPTPGAVAKVHPKRIV